MGRLQSLQVLRFLAALGVVEAHTAANFVGARVGQVGACGVDVFFVISGLVITLTARRHPEGFLRNRALRVLPPYYVWVLPWLLPALASHQLRLATLAASLTLWPVWGDGFTIPALSAGWSLCYEMLFYFAFWLALRGVRPIWLLCAFGAADVLAGLTHLAVFDFIGSPMIVEFLAGVGIALSMERFAASRAVGVVALLAAAAMIGVLTMLGLDKTTLHLIAGPGALGRVLLWGVPAALLVFGALQVEPLLRGAWMKPLVFLGDASYSLYLTHLLVLVAIAQVWPRAPALAAVAICVAVGAATYVLVERPLLRLGRGLVGRRPAAAQLAGA